MQFIILIVNNLDNSLIKYFFSLNFNYLLINFINQTYNLLRLFHLVYYFATQVFEGFYFKFNKHDPTKTIQFMMLFLIGYFLNSNPT